MTINGLDMDHTEIYDVFFTGYLKGIKTPAAYSLCRNLCEDAWPREIDLLPSAFA